MQGWTCQSVFPNQQFCQSAYGGMEHLVFDDTGTLPLKHHVWNAAACSQACRSSALPLWPHQSVTPALRTSAGLAICWPRQWLSHCADPLAVKVRGRAAHPPGLVGATGNCLQLPVEANWEIRSVNTARGEWILFI